MLGPSRPVPKVGAGVRIAHFGGEYERGVITAVFDEGRRLRVRGEEGATQDFLLSASSAQFVADGGFGGARLELIS